MTFKANLGTQSYSEAGVVDQSHPPVVTSMEVLADQGELVPGVIASLNAAGKVVPYDAFDEVIGTGTGAATDFSATLSNPPMLPGSVEVTDGTEIFTDDECGNLVGDAGGTGTVNYVTGDVSVAFNVAVTDQTAVTATYRNRIAGVVTMRVDTTNEDAAPVLEHGTVAQNKISRNGNDPSTDDLVALRAAGIYPR